MNRPVSVKQKEKKIFIGKASSPIAVIKRGDIASYVTEEVGEMYHIWSRFNAGFGLPYSANWGDYPDRFISILDIMNSEYKGVISGHNS